MSSTFMNLELFCRSNYCKLAVGVCHLAGGAYFPRFWWPALRTRFHTRAWSSLHHALAVTVSPDIFPPLPLVAHQFLHITDVLCNNLLRLPTSLSVQVCKPKAHFSGFFPLPHCCWQLWNQYKPTLHILFLIRGNLSQHDVWWLPQRPFLSPAFDSYLA